MKNTCFKEFAKYASLNVLGMIGLSCYILADTFFVSKGLGANGLAALNLAIPVYSFVNGSGLMLGMGGATKYSILKSQKKTEEANTVFTNTVMLSIGISLVFFLVGVFLSGTITQLLGANSEVYEMSKTYLQVILLFAPMFMLNNVLLCFVRNDGAPQLSMIAMITGSLSNIILDYVFIFPFQMGIFGAVLATGIAPIVSILVLSIFFIKRKNKFTLVRCKLKLEISKYIVSTGLPSLITEVSSGVVMIVFNSIILRLSGNMGVAAYGIIANLSLVVISVYTGIAQGIQPLLAKNYGKSNMDNVQVILRYALTTAIIVSLIVYCGILVGADTITNIFNSEQNQLLQSIAVTGLKIYFIGCVFAGINIILSVYFTSTERAQPAHIISLLRGFVLIVPIAFLLSSIGGIIGVWSVFPLTELLVSSVGYMLFIRQKRLFIFS